MAAHKLRLELIPDKVKISFLELKTSSFPGSLTSTSRGSERSGRKRQRYWWYGIAPR